MSEQQMVQSNALSPNEVIKIAKENSFLFKEFCVSAEAKSHTSLHNHKQF